MMDPVIGPEHDRSRCPDLAPARPGGVGAVKPDRRPPHQRLVLDGAEHDGMLHSLGRRRPEV